MAPIPPQPTLQHAAAAQCQILAQPNRKWPRRLPMIPRGAPIQTARRGGREEVVMEAPQGEVLSPAAVPGKPWGPEVGEVGELRGPISFLPPRPPVV